MSIQIEFQYHAAPKKTRPIDFKGMAKMTIPNCCVVWNLQVWKSKKYAAPKNSYPEACFLARPIHFQLGNRFQQDGNPMAINHCRGFAGLAIQATTFSPT